MKPETILLAATLGLLALIILKTTSLWQHGAHALAGWPL